MAQDWKPPTEPISGEWKPPTDPISAIQEPIANVTPEMQKAQQSLTEEHPILGNVLGFGQNMLTGLTSPANLALTGLTFGAGAADAAGFPGVAKLLNFPGRAASLGLAGKGLYDVSQAKDWPGAITGAAETGLGGLGIKQNFFPKTELPAGDLSLNLHPSLPEPSVAESRPKLRLNPNGTWSPIDRMTGEVIGPPFKMSEFADFAKSQEPASGIKVQPSADLDKMQQQNMFGQPEKPKTPLGAINEVANAAKSAMASMDVSAPLRQGIGLISRKEFWTSMNDMFNALGSEEAFQTLQNSLKERPNYKLGDAAGLALTRLKEGISEREELYVSKIAESLPGVRASERAYVGFLNKLRADTFDSLITDAEKAGLNPKTNLKIARDIANYVNTATGRGNLGSLEKYAVELNTGLFSPRLIASRLKLGTVMFDPRTYTQMTPFIRKQYLRSLAGIAGAGLTTLTLAKGAGADVSLDPTSADFGKVKIGNTRLDPWGGGQQYVVAMARLLSGMSTSTKTGRETPYGPSNVVGFGGKYPSFMENKLSPLVKFADDMLSGRMSGKGTAAHPGGFGGMVTDATGQPIPGNVVNLFTPMLINDIIDLAKEDPRLIPLGLPASFGMGVQTYR